GGTGVVVDRDAGPQRAQLDRARPTDAARGAGHQRHLSAEGRHDAETSILAGPGEGGGTRGRRGPSSARTGSRSSGAEPLLTAAQPGLDLLQGIQVLLQAADVLLHLGE